MERMSPDEVLAFLTAGPRTGKLATVRPDGRPHVTPIWFDVDELDGTAIEIVFNTAETSVKGRNLLNDPRLSLCVDDDRPPFSYVVIEGEARMIDDSAELRAWATRIGGRYMGADRAVEYGERNGVPGELLVRVHIHHVVAHKGVSD
ncbi:PPOX class F420-dependent oxidoreductase [Yinghuangia seranimata]|uniref:PPOX class F420-dependent oxidoreductase n=1 Tax=Yinghuangia seranimata TaxID=408067 RepID=UPI00248AA46E|nr:PPOX class F420-dependent oxidoreductase [Yinghuangia seranimata]MDI2131785.1 PPOX class F420-dependent oxidoreductase [Yinghuangia seranimata]